MKLPRPRFSLRTLVVFLLLVTSGVGLWWHWEAWYCAQVLSPRNRHGYVRSAKFSPDERLVAAAFSGSSPRIWETHSGRLVAELEERRDILSIAFSPDGLKVLTCGERPPAIWDARTGRRLCELEGHGTGHPIGMGYVRAGTFSSDGELAATGGEDRTARIWDASTGEQKTVLEGHPAFVINVSFSKDGTRLLTAGYMNCSKLWDAASGKCLVTRTGEQAFFLPGDNAVVSTGSGIHIWDARNGRELSSYAYPSDGWVQDVVISRDGRHVAVTNSDGPTHLCDVSTGRVSNATVDGVTAAFSRDGKVVAIADTKHRVELWDVEAVLLLQALEAGGDTECVVFDESRRKLLTGGPEGTMCLWLRRRPEWWWGVFYLWEFWLTVAFAGVFVWSVVRDRRSLRAKG